MSICQIMGKHDITIYDRERKGENRLINIWVSHDFEYDIPLNADDALKLFTLIRTAYPEPRYHVRMEQTMSTHERRAPGE